jgi:hypothetical protein
MKPFSLTVELARGETAAPFDFRFSEQEYLLRREDGYLSARLPWDSQLQEDLMELASPSPDRGAVQRLGDALGAFLGKLGWAEHEKSLWEAMQAGREVHITFRFAAAEMYSLPWELVALRKSGQHLGELPGCHLHYEWPGVSVPARAAPQAQGGRILFAWSVAGGNVPMKDHLRALREVCARHEYAFDPARDVIGQVSLRSLDAALSASDEPVAALHILCHGARSPDKGSREYGLQWNASQGTDTAFVDAGDLRGVLARHAGKVRMVVLCACQSGNAAPDSHLGSVAQALHRVGIPAVVASRMPLSLRGSTLLTETLYEELIGQLSPLSRALGAARRRLQEDAERLDWASLQLYAQAGDEAALRPFIFRPYRGLLAFRPKDRHFFSGRSKLEAELVERVRQAAQGQRSRFQIVAGASGSGKSSLVMAGLMPQLPKEEWECLVVRPGELVRGGPASTGGRSEALQELRSRVHSLWSSEPLPASGGVCEQELVDEVRRLRQARPAHKLLLVLDQLEEVFTLLTSEERQTLIRGGWALARQPELGCVMVATLRVDSFERCGEVVLEDGRRLDTVVYAEEHRLFVSQMGPEQLAEVIEQPARKVGLELEAGLVDRLVRDMGLELGALPLLEHALDRLWQGRVGERLTHQAYEEMEGMRGALTQTAERLHAELGGSEQAQARRLLVRLVAMRTMATPRARERVWVEELVPQGDGERAAFMAALEKLVSGRLLVTGGGDRQGVGGWVQLAHEMLLRWWGRLGKWVEEDWAREEQLRQLEEWAEDWQRHLESQDGGSSYLLRGDRRKFAKSLQEKHGSEFSLLSQSLIEASDAAYFREQEIPVMPG